MQDFLKFTIDPPSVMVVEGADKANATISANHLLFLGWLILTIQLSLGSCWSCDYYFLCCQS